ncbi:MAG: hypothetical protein AAFR57_10745 [Pseudomonadota bacterium]
MKQSLSVTAMGCAFVAVALPMLAFAAGGNVSIDPPTAATRAEGLAAFDRIFEVASHPRCSNCHVGDDNLPMWSGPSYGQTRPHGMNVNAGESRIGAETLLCSTCHAYRDGLNDVPHAAPQVATSWQLAPVEAEWFGKTAPEICRQLRDPERNGDRDMLELATHLDHDLILHWAWNPGGGREPAPYSVQEHVDDILMWGVAGMPCPEDQ